MNRGLFEPTVLFFGMCNSPATFQAMMDHIFGDMINDCIVIIYMDDIFLFAPDEKTLTENTKKVLTRLWDNDLFLKPTKCEFNQTKIEILRTSNQRRKNLYGPQKAKRIQGLANPFNSQANPRILRVWELLPNDSFGIFWSWQNHWMIS